MQATWDALQPNFSTMYFYNHDNADGGDGYGITVVDHSAPPAIKPANPAVRKRWYAILQALYQQPRPQ